MLKLKRVPSSPQAVIAVAVVVVVVPDAVVAEEQLSRVRQLPRILLTFLRMALCCCAEIRFTDVPGCQGQAS